MSAQIKIHTDGGSRNNPGPAASAFVAYDESQHVLREEAVFLGNATNNVAEYTAVIKALEWVKKINPVPSEVNFFLDSQLVVNQITGIYKIKDMNLQQLSLQIRNHIADLNMTKCSFTYIPRHLNSHADKLVNQCLDENK